MGLPQSTVEIFPTAQWLFLVTSKRSEAHSRDLHLDIFSLCAEKCFVFDTAQWSSAFNVGSPCMFPLHGGFYFFVGLSQDTSLLQSCALLGWACVILFRTVVRLWLGFFITTV